MLDLVEIIFMRFGVRNLRYDGSMTREARDKVIRDFRVPGGPKVMLIRCVSLVDPECSLADCSLASNVVGLGLTSSLLTELSSKFVHPCFLGARVEFTVNSLDLSWNYATESQAYDRVHRMGQEKRVIVRRLVVRDTLEQRYETRWGSSAITNSWSFLVCSSFRM